MAKFLNTSATNYFLEELIKNASDRLILISPFLKLNDRIKELLQDKNRLKIDVRIVYGKNELQPEEINWLRELTYVRTSFCKNLHAKCYLNVTTRPRACHPGRSTRFIARSITLNSFAVGPMIK